MIAECCRLIRQGLVFRISFPSEVGLHQHTKETIRIRSVSKQTNSWALFSETMPKRIDTYGIGYRYVLPMATYKVGVISWTFSSGGNSGRSVWPTIAERGSFPSPPALPPRKYRCTLHLPTKGVATFYSRCCEKIAMERSTMSRQVSGGGVYIGYPPGDGEGRWTLDRRRNRSHRVSGPLQWGANDLSILGVRSFGRRPERKKCALC